MVAFLKQHRIMPRAHLALCKGDVLEAECLKRSDMTPAQAALKWHIQQGVTPCFGHDTLAHIEENFQVQTPEFMSLPPVVAPKPARNLLKLYPWMAMNQPDAIIKDGTRDDKGILRKDADGRYWISTSREVGDKWSDQLAKMSDGEERRYARSRPPSADQARQGVGMSGACPSRRPSWTQETDEHR